MIHRIEKSCIIDIIHKNCQLPVKYFGNSHLSPPLPQADSCGGGVGQDVSTNWLLGISLKPKTGTEKQKELQTTLHQMCQQQNRISSTKLIQFIQKEGICRLLRHSCAGISCHLVGDKHCYVIFCIK